MEELLNKYQEKFWEEIRIRNYILHNGNDRNEYRKHNDYAFAYMWVCRDIRLEIKKANTI